MTVVIDSDIHMRIMRERLSRN